MFKFTLAPIAYWLLPWLLVLPVDVFDLPENLFERLAQLASPQGAWLRDAGGLQPLLGLWPAAALSVLAHLIKLVEDGTATVSGPPSVTTEFRPA